MRTYLFDVNIDRPELNAEFDNRYPGGSQRSVYDYIILRDNSIPSNIYHLGIDNGRVYIEKEGT